MALPSKKIAILLVTTVVVVSAVISVTSYKDRVKAEESLSESPEAQGKIITVKRDLPSDGKDRDNDGLLDWEEVLWSTDPDNPDSDGDSASDGDEIKEGRNPNVAGPNDTFREIAENNAPVIYDKKVAGTLTDNLSINLASNYFNLKQNQNVNAESAEELVNAITSDVSNITAQTAKNNVYSNLSVVTYPGNATEDKRYGEVMILMQNNLLLDLKSYESLADDIYISTVAKAYEDHARNLSNVSVPQGVLSAHVEMMNNYHNMSLVFKDIQNYETDPVKALLAIRSYQEISEKQNEVLVRIGKYFKDNDIIFDDGTVGAVWNTL